MEDGRSQVTLWSGSELVNFDEAAARAAVSAAENRGVIPRQNSEQNRRFRFEEIVASLAPK